MFRLFAFIAGATALLAIPLFADSRWGPSGCTAQPAVTGARNASYEWKTWPDWPEAALYRDGRQIGGWNATKQHYRPLLDYRREIWGDPQDKAPFPPPAALVRPADGVLKPPAPAIGQAKPEPPIPDKDQGKLAPWEIKGVDPERLSGRVRHSISGSDVVEEEALGAILAGVLPDDSGKLWLSIWSRDAAKRAAVVEDLKKDPLLWAWVNERCHVWAGAAATPDHFLAHARQTDPEKAKRGEMGPPLYAFDGDPLIMLQDRNGVELWHDAGYQQGPPSLQGLRKADPLYKPDKTPGPKTPDAKKKDQPAGGTDLTPLAILGAAGVGGLVISSLRKQN
jgi:hypothetical protein